MTRFPPCATLPCVALAAWVVSLAGPAAFAVLIDSGDGRGNTTPPPDDPGWERMGTKAPCPPHCGLSYVYLGNGWVLTARHVGAHDVRFSASGREYAKLPDSVVRFGGERGNVDLLLFRIRGAPPLPLLPICDSPPSVGEPVLMIGRGKSRGRAMPGSPRPGWTSVRPATMRWGTNRVDRERHGAPTRVFSLRFDAAGDPAATPFEAQATPGDSGGPVFVKRQGRWELAGIMITATPARYGVGFTGAVDLSFYRAEILAIVAD